MSDLLVALCATLGLACGPTLNLVVDRGRFDGSLVLHCPLCRGRSRARDRVPVLSWLLLRGRCRSCTSQVSTRRPLVELTCAGLFGGTAARLGFDWDLPAFLVLFAGLLALTCTDIERLVLPKRIVYPILGLVALLLTSTAAATGRWDDLLVAGLSAIAWFLAFFALNAASPRLLGFGDVRLAPLLGLALGWFGVRYVLLGFFVANLIGAVVGVVLITTKQIGRSQQIPYGAFLALGTAITVLVGPELFRQLRELS